MSLPIAVIVMLIAGLSAVTLIRKNNKNYLVVKQKIANTTHLINKPGCRKGIQSRHK